MSPCALAAKALGIPPDEQSAQHAECVKRRATAAIAPLNPYFEEDPTVKEWLLEHRPTVAGSIRYFKSLFPFVGWIGRYNLQWLAGDVIGGITLGFVVVPQAMAYSMLAGLRPEYGLYTSFTGASLYWIFATSKDVAIGAVAVISLLVGRIGDKVQTQLPGTSVEQSAKTVAFLCGAILLAFGLLRLDWLIELIPHVAIAAFVTGSAITISLSQVPSLLGITGVNTRDAPYRVLIDTCKALPRTTVDAAVGLTALFLLQLIKWFCTRMAARQKHRARTWETISAIRMTFVILLYTLISFLVNRGLPAKEAKFRILGPVPTGFQAAGPPSLDSNLVKLVAPELPALLIVVIIEQIAIAKSFGRTNNYTIVPSQEMISLGAANLLGAFIGGYAATASFGGSAVLSKAGARTPLSSVFNGLVLLMAVYALTSIFFYIPLAALAGLILHAVNNLITPPATIVKYWQVSPIDVLIFFAGVFVSIFQSLEFGIYVTVGISFVVFLFRVARSQGRFLGRIEVHQHGAAPYACPGADKHILHHPLPSHNLSSRHHQTREVFLPLDRKDGSNPVVEVRSAYPGVFIYRFTEGFNYINQAQYLDHLVAHITSHTRRMENNDGKRPGDRPWNEQPPNKDGSAEKEAKPLPLLHAVVLDMGAVNQVDATAMEALEDVRAQLGRWAAPGTVEWHLAGVRSRWTRRALGAAGFGYPSSSSSRLDSWMPIFDVAATASPAQVQHMSTLSSSVTLFGEGMPGAQSGGDKPRLDLESGEDEGDIGLGRASMSGVHEDTASHSQGSGASKVTLAPVVSIDRPFIHVDLASAVTQAVESARRRGRSEDQSHDTESIGNSRA